MKKILVTGCNGFMGNHLICRLVKEDVSVIASSRLNKNKIKPFSWINQVEYIKFNIKNYSDTVFKKFGSPNHIIHLAWQGLSDFNDKIHMEENMMSSYFFLKEMIKGGVSTLTVIGTCAEYGLQEGCLSEKNCPSPLHSYAIAKDNLRRMITVLKKNFDFNFNWIRPFYLYGEGQNPNSLLSSLDHAIEQGDSTFNMSPGDQIRDFIHVSEAVDIITKISLLDKDCGIVNCCSGNPISVKDMVQNYLKEKGKSIELNLGYYPYSDLEPMSFWGDRTKLNSLLK